MFGLFATATMMSVGCAAGTDASLSEDPGSSSQAQIAALGTPIVSGCNVSQMFDIQAPSSSNIGFVAVSNQNLNDMEAQLFAVDQQGNQTALNTSAQQTSAAMQAMLNQALSSSTLAVNNNSASSSNASQAATTTTSAANTSNSATAQNSAQASGSDTTTATHAQHADAVTSQTAAANNNAFSTAQSALIAALLGGGFSSSFFNAANGANFLGANTTATSSDSSTADTLSHQFQMQAANSSSSANQSSTAATNSTATQAANQAAAQNSNLAQTAANQNFALNASNANQAANSITNAQNLSFSDLASQNLQHVRVLVTAVANSTQQTTNVFTGLNQSVFASGSFGLGLGCGGAVTPVIAP